MDNKTLKLLEFFYNNDGIKISNKAVVNQLQNNDRDALEYLRLNKYILQSEATGIITITRYGREIVDLHRREQQLFEIQKSNNSIQERLQFVQYALAFIALVNVIFVVWSFFR